MATPILKRTDAAADPTAPSLQRHFMELAYLGAPYHGWQTQPDAESVQSEVERALSTLMRAPVAIVGAGRTDAGVNASKMIAHFDLVTRIDDDSRLVRALNSILGPAIAVRWIHPMHAGAHARFDATSRTYHYYAHQSRNPFVGGLSWRAPVGLDFDAMNRAAEALLETEDFTSFSKLHTDVKTNICRVTKALWRPVGRCDATPAAAEWVFEITADRFLRNMVRAVVGTLVDVGRGKIDVDGFRRIIAEKNRCSAGTSMPAGPLFLHDITYPYAL